VVVAGQWVADSPSWSRVFTLSGVALAFAIIAYGFAGIRLAGLAAAGAAHLSQRIYQGWRHFFSWLQASCLSGHKSNAALTRFIDGPLVRSLPARFSPLLHYNCLRRDQRIPFPDFFRHHSKDDPSREPCPLIGYGAMLLESFVGVMAMVAACAMPPGVYFAINSPPSIVGGAGDAAARNHQRLGTRVQLRPMTDLAHKVGEITLWNLCGRRAFTCQ